MHEFGRELGDTPTGGGQAGRLAYRFQRGLTDAREAGVRGQLIKPCLDRNLGEAPGGGAHATITTSARAAFIADGVQATDVSGSECWKLSMQLPEDDPGELTIAPKARAVPESRLTP